ncbi:hypothetical protein R3P38DRAFT_3224092 [Favolaschia claudopus]|uniref:DRBM domain-containing protein n=1 Tax=Favolaschia claudopus TaxID=2862362 RepID=A0AAV9ZVX8_9AGAR
MTNLNTPAPGTATSVPGGAAPAAADTAAALQTVLAAMAHLTMPSSTPTPSAPPAPTASPAIAAPAPAAPAPAPVTPPVPAGLRTQGPWLAGWLYLVVPPQHLQHIAEPTYDNPDDAPRWYSINKGRYVGVTTNNGLALNAVSGVSGSKKHRSQVAALAAFNQMLDYGMVAVLV